ncbi:hypothetical protein [Rathayibacter toxicus]|nr:hypothetical protein [Rathayibacter toxicus]QOD08189.1 hypothetical protein AYW78_10155 [Rathayibacter toxicus]QWL26848.1 hypothetical protein E2R32_09980 [Rathayibacter toxicus]QWL31060.1 hypothetical protein E2R34_10115 [Rathayibacter toxicus]QWL49896.1 hypothetical protein E2R43_09970 [Rathayibacter toxicus]QWL51955.1 hypothetical protein E2R44_09990 [Rathayibacter toxicus]
MKAVHGSIRMRLPAHQRSSRLNPYPAEQEPIMEHLCTRPLEVDDAIAVVGILAALEALVLGNRLTPEQISPLHHALAQGHAALARADRSEVGVALGSLNLRLCAAIGP